MYEVGRIQKKFQEKPLVIGAHVRSQDPCFPEMLGSIGYDIIWVENEHSNLDKYQTTMHLIAAQATGAAALVRVPWNDPVLIKPILEMGPDGVVIPMVNTAEEARRAVAACTYPPKGIRGAGPIRANNYGLVGWDEYLANADRQIFKIIQIEHIDGVNNIEEILDVPGVDAIIVGQFDLSGSLGILSKVYEEENLRCIRKVFDACNRRGIPCGITTSPEEAVMQLWLDMGARFLFLCNEYEWVRMASQPALQLARTLGGRTK